MDWGDNLEAATRPRAGPVSAETEPISWEVLSAITVSFVLSFFGYLLVSFGPLLAVTGSSQAPADTNLFGRF